MSRKEAYLENIAKTQKELENKILQVELVLDGASAENLHLETKSECSFGKWLYQDEKVKHHLGFQQYEKLDLLHTQWHTNYAKIYQIFHQKKGLFGKLLGGSKPSPQELDKAKAYLDDLKVVTDELIRQLLSCKRRITALSESKFT